MENPLIPMGTITGSPDRKKIHEVLAFYRERGITQFLIYLRSGCQLHYLPEDWFRVCSEKRFRRTRLRHVMRSHVRAHRLYRKPLAG